jgi:hypothetical protein
MWIDNTDEKFEKEFKETQDVFVKDREFNKWKRMYDNRFRSFYNNMLKGKVPDWVVERLSIEEIPVSPFDEMERQIEEEGKRFCTVCLKDITSTKKRKYCSDECSKRSRS